MASGTAIVLFTRDLRVHDNPALHDALAEAEQVVPLFVLDEAILSGGYNRPNRARFLAESLADLDASLKERGARLVVRRGDVAEQTAQLAHDVGAGRVHVAGDASGYARQRLGRLREELGEVELHIHDDSLFVVPPGVVTATGKQHMAVFSAYFRKWAKEHTRDPLPAPEKIVMPRVGTGSLPRQEDIAPGETAPDQLPGGEGEGRRRMTRWLEEAQDGYADDHDALGADRTSRLSSYLHFGCLSPTELVHRADNEALIRQVAWRDFHAQVLAANPRATRADYRSRGDRWRRNDSELQAWKQGRTGYPVVDAGMRQLLAEGWMHNRARLIVGHFLCKTLYQDWRLGAQHFVDHLIDGDTANNTMNWQWVAGTGTDSRFNRVYAMVTQGKRHDPNGDYVRRYVPELADIEGAAVHEPWTLPEEVRGRLDYPDPIVDNREGNDRFLAARGKR